MTRSLFTSLSLLIAVVFGGPVTAQLTINDANASLDINGMQASIVDPPNHVVPINVTTTAALDIHINSGPNSNVGVILLASGSPVAHAVLTLPWNDSIDLGALDTAGNLANVILVADGVGLSVNPLLDPLAVTDTSGDYHYTGTVSPGLATLADPSVAVQAIVQDPNAFPFFFDNTEAADVLFNVGQVITSYTLGDDDFVQHALGIPIDFGGTLYNSLFLNSNGYVTFQAGSAGFGPAVSNLFNGWNIPGNAGVALALSDLNLVSGLSGGAAAYVVVENPTNGIVETQFNNQNWAGGGPPNGVFAGNFKAIFNDTATVAAGGVILDLAGLVPFPFNYDDFVVGVTDGDDATVSGMGTDTDLSNGMNTGFVNAIASGYTSTMGPDSVAELFQSSLTGPGGANPPPLIRFAHLGGFQWFIF